MKLNTAGGQSMCFTALVIWGEGRCTGAWTRVCAATQLSRLFPHPTSDLIDLIALPYIFKVDFTEAADAGNGLLAADNREKNIISTV